MKAFPRRIARLLVLVLAVLSAGALGRAQTGLLITQVYGGGGSTSTNPTPSYKNDFIEIFNAGTTAVDLSTYSLQYGPAGSTASPNTSFTGITVLSSTALSGGKLAPGQYFLVQEASATNATGATLGGPDQTGTISMAAASAKVALVNGTTLLSATGACSSTSIVSLVGYGTLGSTTCAEGGAPVNALSTTTAAIRNASCTDSGSNQADFTPQTPAPRNSSTTLAPCSGTAPVAALSITSATATPASIKQGDSTTLSVVVQPGSSSTGITVQADLSTIGASSTQALTLSSTANTYTYAATTSSSLVAGSYSLPITVSDAQGGSATGSISLTVQPTVVTTPIATLQANRATYVGTSIQTSGIVTLVTSSGWYMQTQSSTPGSTGDEGLYVYKGSSTVTGVVVGNLITVTGTLTQYPSAATSHTPSLELTTPSVTVTSTGNTLPTAIALTSLTPGGGIYQLKPYESMLVSFPSVTSITGTGGSLTEASETIVSTGQFFVTVTGVARPFREPGMDFRDFPTATCPTKDNCTATATSANVTRPTNLVLYDDNPERLIIESSLGGGTPLDVSTGAVLTNPTGVIDFSYSTDVPYGDPARLILLPNSVTSANYTPGISVQPLAVPNTGEVTIAAFNVERFFNTSSADNKYYNAATGNVGNSSAVNVTAAAYARRLQKVSLAIRNVLNTPDVLSIEEVENVSVLNDISAQIDTDATAAGQTPPHYAAYGTDSATTYTDDVGGISIGFLVKPATVNVKAFEQMGATSTFQASSGTQTLNDRPSDVLHVGFKRANGAADYPMTLISNHLRSLSGIGTSADTRLKKELQAEMLATLIQGYQTNGEHVLAMGDLNAFEFSDGYTDTLGTITGRVADATTVVQAGKAIVNPVATDLATQLPASQRQSYVEFGNAQVLDHIVATADIASTTRLAYAHLNSDFPEILLNDATSPSRTSDHDAALAYVPVPAATITGTVTGTGTFPAQALGSTSNPTQVLTITNTGETPITITAIAATGDFAQSNNCPASLALAATCAVNVSFTPTAVGARTGALTVTSNASGLGPVTLTGTGTAANSTTTVVTAQTPTTFGQSVTFTATITASSGPAPTGSVVFSDGTTALGTYPVTGGKATYTTTTLAVGTHTITAAYQATTNDAASSGSVVQTVTAATTVTALAASPNPAAASAPVVLTATVTATTGGTPTGSVQFLDGTTTLGTAALANGVATYTATLLAPGSHVFTANYVATTNDAASSGKVTVVVNNPLATTTALTTSQTPTYALQSVTFTATVSGTAAPTGNFVSLPTGSVVFADGGVTLATVALTNGTAAYSTSTLLAGTHTITATYSGSTAFAGSAASVSQVVASAPFFLTGPGTSSSFTLAVSRGATTSAQLTVTPIAGFAGVVTLACDSVPASLTCSLQPTTLTFTSGGTAQTATVTFNTVTAVTAQNREVERLNAVRLAGLAFPALLLTLAGRRRLRLPARLLLVLCFVAGGAALLSLTGCSTAQPQTATTPAGTYNVNITATSGTGRQVVPVTLTVQ